jgi:hypothetical protein
MTSVGILFAQPRIPAEKPGPPKLGVLLPPLSEFEVGVGNVSKDTCMVSAGTQPGVYAGNSLVDCDAEVPHNETTIVVNPNNSNHIVGGYHSYRLNLLGATANVRVVGAVSVSFDGGVTWQQSFPPIAPYQFTGDPALSFNGDGRLYFANIADHEGPGGGPFTAPSIVVAHSDDGGLTWSNPVTVASGLGSITPGRIAPLLFQDKEFIAADSGASSPFRNRVYVTWTSFLENPRGPNPSFRAPILVSYSDNGTTWSAPQEISGSSTFCSVQFGGGPANQCDEDQFSAPAVAPTGRVYVGFENFNTAAENQYMVVSSTDGGITWSGPSRVGTVHDINLPLSVDNRSTLSGCQFRVIGPGNIAADPSDPTGMRVYAVWADNRNGTSAATNMDLFLYRSTDGGGTWSLFQQVNDATDQYYPWVAVAPSGRVDIGYMDRQYSSGQSVCQYGFTLTRIDGTTGAILSKQRVDTGLSDPGQSRWFSATTGGNSLFIGDYNGIAVAPNGTTHSLWTDQRNIVPNPPSPTRNHGQHAVEAKTP